jgi:UDP-N-acetylmuramoyl-tripeptide--D-alanyl-D-alanine ligase
VPQFDPTHLATWTSGHWIQSPEVALSGWTIDSRRVQSGEVFVALKTEQRDGHAFLSAAATAGAAAALVSAPDPAVPLPQLVVEDTLIAFQKIALEHRRQFTGRVIGITGSAGKTSTKNLLAGMLGERTWATSGNFNNHLGVPLSLLALDPAGHDFGVIEAGISGPHEMDTLAAMIEPDAAIVTLVDHAHTEGLKDLAGVAREKVKLPQAVPVPGDKIMPDPVARLAPFQGLADTQVVVRRVEVLGRPAGENTAEFIVTQGATETVIGYVAGSSAPETYTLVRTSDGMAQNAALAITAARRSGRSSEQVQAGLSAWRPAELRGEVRQQAGRLVYVDCYNANPAAMSDAASAFDGMTRRDGKARLFVLGGMEELGAESPALHEKVGRSLPLQPGDQLALIGTDADSLRAGAVAAGLPAENIEIVADATALRAKMRTFTGAVFIKGSRRYALETLLVEETNSSP